MSTESIKACSGQFDLESVYKLLMERMELRAIEALAPCTNLEVLDLSHNRLVRIEGLDGLLKLKTLRLAHNEIGTLEGLDHLAALEVLALDGNRITAIDGAACLTKLARLRTLSLQAPAPPGLTPPPAESNPCCQHPAYRVTLRRLVPQLTSLDGERLALVDASGARSHASAMPTVCALPNPNPNPSPKPNPNTCPNSNLNPVNPKPNSNQPQPGEP